MAIREVTVDTVSAMREAGERFVLVDVRGEGEHEMARIEPCVLIPLPELDARIDELAEVRDEKIVVYCHHGVRSRSGAAILEAHGFKDVASMRGGIDAWSLRVDANVPRY
jgi:rhodanese-related sulfurtransferase